MQVGKLASGISAQTNTFPFGTAIEVNQRYLALQQFKEH